MKITNLLGLYFRGFGQIMLQESCWTGALFVIGILVSSNLMLVGALLGALTSVAGAKLLKLASEDELFRGYFGFNGALVGIAALFFLPLSFYAVALIVGGSILSSFIMRWLSDWGRLPPYTAPFILSGWIMLFLARIFGLAENNLGVEASLGEFAAISRGIGQVMFQDNWLAGAIFLVGLAVCSLEAVSWAIIGSSLGLICALGLGYPASLTFAGIFGFNASLVGIALSNKFRNASAPLLGIILSVFITRGFQVIDIPPLTAPFVLSSWLVIVASGFAQKPTKIL
jgi:urea transporter